MGKWLVIGAAAVDTIAAVPQFPKPDEIVYPTSVTQLPGGSSANIAVGLARLGEAVTFLGKTGDDASGAVIRQSFEEEGVSTARLLTVPGARSGGAFIAVTPDGERVIYSLGGTALIETPDELDEESFEGIDGLYIGEAFKEVGEKAAELAHRNGAAVFFGPGGIMCGYGLDYLGGTASASDHLLLNLPEALALTGCDSKDAAVECLLAAGVKHIIITEGKRGAGSYTKEGSCFCHAEEVKAVDTTGAGDTFSAGYLYAVVSHPEWLTNLCLAPTSDRSASQCLAFAAACAAEAVKTVGARSSMPTLSRMMDVMGGQNAPAGPCAPTDRGVPAGPCAPTDRGVPAGRESFEKACAALSAFALGDALGMPTELISPEEIRKLYGRVDTLVAPHPTHYHAGDLSRGMITDDTEVTLEVMEAIIRNGGISVEAAVDALLTWSKACDVKNKSYLGPSSRRALEAIEAGTDPVLAGRNGTTDGAPMRILPIGIFNAGDPKKAAEDACTFCIPTHGSNVAMAGAGAVAAAVAEALKGNSSVESVIAAALDGADLAETKGYFIRDCELRSVFEEFLDLSRQTDSEEAFLKAVFDKVGFSMETDLIVPAALVFFARYQGDPMKAILASANLGGDTDTIGALAGGICGAFSGAASLDMALVREVEAINKIDLRERMARFVRFSLGLD